MVTRNSLTASKTLYLKAFQSLKNCLDYYSTITKARFALSRESLLKSNAFQGVGHQWHKRMGKSKRGLGKFRRRQSGQKGPSWGNVHCLPMIVSFRLIGPDRPDREMMSPCCEPAVWKRLQQDNPFGMGRRCVSSSHAGP